MKNKKIETLDRGHIVRSSIWVFGGQFGGQLLRLISNLIMTRLLIPEMFGVMAVANTIILGLALCSYIGLQHNIIQNPRGDEQDFLNTAWTMQVLRGVLLWLIALGIGAALYFASQAGLIPVDSAYADKSLPMIILVLSFMPLISGFESTKLSTASRHMQVRMLTMIEIGCQILGLIIMITLAVIFQSIWALVAGTMVGATAKVFASFMALPGQRNFFFWEKRAARDLFHFGKWILLTTIMGFFVRNGDKLILGALITSQVLGIYSIAIFMTGALFDVFSRWAAAIVLPVLSRTFREKPKELSNVYYKISTPFNLVTLFVCGFLFNTGYIVIDLLYDSRYSAAGPMIQILSIGLLGSRTIIAEQCYLAMSKPKISVPMNILQLTVLFTALVPVYHRFGMEGALYVIGLTILLTLPMTWYFLKRLGVLDWKRELVTLPALFAGYVFSKLFAMLYESIKSGM